MVLQPFHVEHPERFTADAFPSTQGAVAPAFLCVSPTAALVYDWASARPQLMFHVGR